MLFMLRRQAIYSLSLLCIGFDIFLIMLVTLQTRFLLLVHPLITRTYLFWTPSPKFSSSMAQTHAFKREQKLLKLCNISKTPSMRESVKSRLLVSNSSNVSLVFEITFRRSDYLESSVEDGKLMADAEAGEFWAQFGGFAPLPRNTTSEEIGKDSEIAVKLLW